MYVGVTNPQCRHFSPQQIISKMTYQFAGKKQEFEN
jgi:hypothetical protein